MKWIFLAFLCSSLALAQVSGLKLEGLEEFTVVAGQHVAGGLGTPIQ